MRGGVFRVIIVAERTNLTAAAKGVIPLGNAGTESSDRPASARVAICGDPVVGQALALLLRSSRYEARFVPVGASGEPGPLDDVRVVVLVPTPELNAGQRKVLVGAFREAMVGIPVLELVPSWARAEPGHQAVPWPCNTEELERRIDEALCAAADGGG
jgi:hypothetical protein